VDIRCLEESATKSLENFENVIGIDSRSLDLLIHVNLI